MKFELARFSTIRIFVKDVKESRDWYAQLFDLNPIEDIDGFVSFNLAGTCFDIVSQDDKNPFSIGGSAGYWLVDDVDLVLKKAEMLGGKLYRGPLKVPEIQRTIMQIQDPFGNVIGFESPTPGLS